MKNKNLLPPVRDKKPIDKNELRRLLILVLNTLLFFTVYRVLIYYGDMTESTFASFVTMVVYMVLLLGFVLGYLIYNRFLYRKGVTRDELPDDWSEEEKTAFIEDGERRLQKSKWVLTVLVPIALVFAVDMIYLFVIPMLFGGGV